MNCRIPMLLLLLLPCFSHSLETEVQSLEKFEILATESIPDSNTIKKSTEVEKKEIQLTTVLVTPSGEFLEGIEIGLVGMKEKALTDEFGMAAFTLMSSSADSAHFEIFSDSLRLEVSGFFLDSSKAFQQFVLRASPPQKDEAKPALSDSAVIVIYADEIRLHDRKKISKRSLHREEIRKIAASQGDPIRTLNSLPGVSTQNDLSVRPLVRGGDERETRVFWNGIPLLQPYHAMSFFSIFNMESIESMEFYSGAFPVDGNNSLSGALYMKSQPAPLDSMTAAMNTSFFRASTAVGVPILPGKLGVRFAYQEMLYEKTLKSAVWLADKFGGDIGEGLQLSDLPNFKDVEFGLSWRVNESLKLSYDGLLARDVFNALTLRDTVDALGRDKKQLDTLARVHIPNQFHAITGVWTPNEKLVSQQTLALQKQTWDVQWFDEEEPIFDMDLLTLHLRSRNGWKVSPKHFLVLGGSWDWWKESYQTDLFRAVYELVTKGRTDVQEALGLVNDEGFTLDENTMGRPSSFSTDLIRMQYKGKRRQQFFSLFAGDNWKADNKQRLEYGLRLEGDNLSKSAFPAPRVSWFRSLDQSQEISLALGLYSQNMFPFYYRHFSPNLQPEKAWHLGAEWSKDFGPRYRLEWNNYGKWYFDLAAARLVPTGKVNSRGLSSLLRDLTGLDPADWLLSVGADTAGLYGQFDQLIEENLDSLPAASRNLILQFSGEQRLEFANTGEGWAAGSELSFQYDPNKIWRGWASVEYSWSRRRSTPQSRWYDFGDHRPWSFKWHNFFDMPNRYELSFRWQISAGRAYTGFDESSLNQDSTLGNSSSRFNIHPRNSDRYAPYSRLDIRLAKNGTLFNHPYTSYFEVWNAFNSPNFLLRDDESEKIVNIDLSYPIPVFFLGFEWRW